MPVGYLVTLSPSGRQIRVEPGETILAAARREQLPLAFNCERGNCGECRARILEGKLAEHLHHDYVFKASDQLYPMLLSCRAIPASDMMIELLEVAEPTDVPMQSIDATVTRVERLGGDMAALHLRTPRSKPLQFLAGQYVSLSVDSLPAQYKSVASCPCNGRDLQFHVHYRPDDEFSRYVFDQLEPKAHVLLEGPGGDFILSGNDDRRMLFIAIDGGFAPIKSLIEHAVSSERYQPMHLVWLAQEAGGHYLANQCRAWRDALDNFSFELLGPDAEPGLFTGSLKEWLQADIYINGPETIAAKIVANLQKLGANSILVGHTPHPIN